MKTPSKLYRYRPLEDALLDRELSALCDSYLYAPPFAAMNDPMEAFYETGGLGDRIISAMLAPAGKRIDGVYEMLSEMIDRFALVSFAGTHEDLPMWAYSVRCERHMTHNSPRNALPGCSQLQTLVNLSHTVVRPAADGSVEWQKVGTYRHRIRCFPGMWRLGSYGSLSSTQGRFPGLPPRVRHLNERLEIVQPGALIQVDLHVRSFCSLVLADNEFHEALPFKPDAAEQVGRLSMLRV